MGNESLVARSRAHLEDVEESYGAHQRFAFGAGWAMVKGALACMPHGLVPALFPPTGSPAIRKLHGIISDRERVHELGPRREGLSVLLLLALINAAVPWLAGAPVLAALPLSLLS